ncbi:MAG: Fe-S protein assembly co-chaperone HscB [Proteobacteria bacterium]|jgi:molecular chaperone HscB|nr:Fe-S protein assembly co-chaperone HscB [Pseudomonadota bacterium]MDA1034327.1 Fe-S protein assembly co-chaperone HscB [Pseudomonadota bacterium]
MKFFEIFEIKPTFKICQNNLKKKFLELQKKYHPDNYASASGHEKTLALLNSSMINDAFEILKDDLKRAEYLLKCNKIEQNNQTNPEFLIKQMEYEDYLEENSHHLNKIEMLHKEIAQTLECEIEKLTILFNQKNLVAASNKMNELIFLSKFKTKLKQRMHQII